MLDLRRRDFIALLGAAAVAGAARIVSVAALRLRLKTVSFGGLPCCLLGLPAVAASLLFQ